MPIDPNIALGYRGIEVPNPLNQFAQVQQLQANEMKMQEAMAANQERNALRKLDPTAADYENQLFKVNPQLGIQFRKERSAAEASQAMTAQHKAEAASKRAAFAAQGERDLARNPSNANITAWLEDTQASDLFTPQEKAAAQKQAEMYLGMPVEKRAAAMQMRGATSGDYTARGQLGVAQGQLKVAQDRLAQDAQAVTYQQDANGNYVALPTKLPAGAVPTARSVIAPGGGMTPLQGKDSSKTAVSEQQAAYNIGRILNAAKQIDTVVKTNPSAIQPGAMEAGFSAVGMKGTANASRNADRQIVSGAQRDALDAMLYLATGAAYNKEQLEGQMEAYIPQYTDKPERVASKQMMMTQLIQSAKVRAGKAWTPEMESAVQSLMNPSAASGGGVDAGNPLLKP